MRNRPLSDAFDGEGLSLFHHHVTSSELGRGRPQLRGQSIARAGKEMVGLETSGLREPEIGNLREDLAFARDAVGHDAIERRDAVGGDEEEAVAEVKDFADFAAFDFADAGQVELQERFVQHEQRISSKFKVQSLKLGIWCVGRIAGRHRVRSGGDQETTMRLK